MALLHREGTALARSTARTVIAGLVSGLLAALACVLLALLLPTSSKANADPFVASTPPTSKGFAVFPGAVQLDSATGLHVTGEARAIDSATWRLSVSGKVRRSLSLSLVELWRLPSLATSEPIICEGYFEDRARWSGASLKALLDRAGIDDGATTLTLVGADGYQVIIALAEARSDTAFLAYEWEGRPLPVLHGYPLRAAFPGLPGNRWVKWLMEIRVQ